MEDRQVGAYWENSIEVIGVVKIVFLSLPLLVPDVREIQFEYKVKTV